MGGRQDSSAAARISSRSAPSMGSCRTFPRFRPVVCKARDCSCSTIRTIHGRGRATRAVRRGGGVLPPPRHAADLGSRIQRAHLRRRARAERAPSPRREGRHDRVPFVLEDVQHGGLAHRVRRGWTRPDRRALRRAHEVGYGTPVPIQEGAAYALDHAEELSAPVVARYRARRDALASGFGSLGWSASPCRATMFQWLPVPPAFTAQEWTQHLIDRAGVVVTPATRSGPAATDSSESRSSRTHRADPGDRAAARRPGFDSTPAAPEPFGSTTAFSRRSNSGGECSDERRPRRPTGDTPIEPDREHAQRLRPRAPRRRTRPTKCRCPARCPRRRSTSARKSWRSCAAKRRTGDPARKP